MYDDSVQMTPEQVPATMYFAAKASYCTEITSKGMYQTNLFETPLSATPGSAVGTIPNVDEAYAIVEIQSFSAAVQGVMFFYSNDAQKIGMHHIPGEYLSPSFWVIPN